MVQNIGVEKVRGKQGIDEFIRFPWEIYKDDPFWVPPLLEEQRVMFSPRYPFFEHGEIELYLARREKETVGRVAAVLDRDYVDFSHERAVFFGFFESIQDGDVARALIDEVRVWGKSQEMNTIRGPFNPSTNDACGLLSDGFDMAPMLMMPYNPAYYVDLMKACGLEKSRELYAYLLESGASLERLEGLADRIQSRLPDLTVRPVRLKKIQEELRIVRDIYNDAWRENWGFVPITESEIDFIASRLKPLVVEDLFLFAEVEGEAVAFIGTFPDYNQVLRRLNGKIGLIGALKFLYYSRKIRDLRTMLLGVKHGFQKRGVEVFLYKETIKRALRRGYERSELSWILEDNTVMRQAVETLGARRYKTYCLYEAPVS